MKPRPLTSIEIRQERDDLMRRLADLPLVGLRRKPVRSEATTPSETVAATKKRKVRSTTAAN